MTARHRQARKGRARSGMLRWSLGRWTRVAALQRDCSRDQGQGRPYRRKQQHSRHGCGRRTEQGAEREGTGGMPTGLEFRRIGRLGSGRERRHCHRGGTAEHQAEIAATRLTPQHEAAGNHCPQQHGREGQQQGATMQSDVQQHGVRGRVSDKSNRSLAASTREHDAAPWHIAQGKLTPVRASDSCQSFAAVCGRRACGARRARRGCAPITSSGPLGP